MASGGAKKPMISIDERKAGFVTVRCKIEKIKPKKRGIFSGFGKGHGDDAEKAKNAKTKCTFEDQGFTLSVTMDPVKDKDGQTWLLEKPSLPHPIDASESYYEVEDGFISIFLKTQQGDDWSYHVRTGKLEG